MPEQKVVIITAAGGGIGAACARAFAADGYRVALMSRSDGAARLAAELGGIGVAGSVTAPADLQNLVDQTVAAYGRVDAVVNNTGHPPKGELLAISDEAWHQGLDLLLLNVVRLARLVTPLMAAAGGGAIVNISTFAVFEPDLAFPVSGTIRAALASFTKLYADQYAAQGIRMNNLLPGFVANYAEDPVRRAQIPAGRYARLEEIGGTALFLASPAAAYLTGQNLRVDGGLTRSV